jgi:hypothetical protein
VPGYIFTVILSLQVCVVYGVDLKLASTSVIKGVWETARLREQSYHSLGQSFPNRGAPQPPGWYWSSGGGGGNCLYEGHLYLTKYGRKINCNFGRHFAWLKCFTYHLVSTGTAWLAFCLDTFSSYSNKILAPYKQQIFLPAKIRKVCYSLAELYVRSVYLNLFGWRGAWSSWNI